MYSTDENKPDFPKVVQVPRHPGPGPGIRGHGAGPAPRRGTSPGGGHPDLSWAE